MVYYFKKTEVIKILVYSGNDYICDVITIE